ncbi:MULTISPECIES: hypothetical protein [unclassified Streptomyces]|uniref:hypothetical protein n=1 Tax=unclassified Streptomyces TaxID=2593676 RepID=UPI00081ECCBE|nr:MULTISPECIES: hypothetical protein [unclassified Streptomyces]MYZ39496.1 hypothetical protein [Streptomyces sp. SID4917]SCG04002.1 hypothetical protein GA0115259_108678 [Streptomyces sp. MnatMP-M17]
MAHHFANTIPAHLLMWHRVREYAVPPSMIETATARRAVGDWAGACAAARVDIDLDLRAVRDRHGIELVTRLRADLRRLAPDLLRWHLPRTAPDGRLRAGLTISLARYRSSGDTPLQLVVRTPPAWADAGQRVSLALWEESRVESGSGPGHLLHPHPHPHPNRRFRLDLHRHLWDSERSGELAWRCGAGEALSLVPAARPPASDRLHAPARPDVPDVSYVPAVPDVPDRPAVHDSPWEPARWAAEAEFLLRAEGCPRGAFTVRLGTRSRAVLELVAPDNSHAPTFRPLRETLPPQEVAALPVLPEAAARVLPDLELLRAGLVATDRLHPLVATALAAFGSAASSSSGPATGLALPPGDPHRVECRGEVHRIALRDGTLTAIDHDPAQLRREELLVALGGPALPCLRAIDEVHRDPEALPAVRERLGHGDVAGALAVVEGLLGPGAVLRDGPLREELESAAARRIDHGLFRSGLVAVHPGAGSAAGGTASDLRHAEARHRPRLDRRTPRAMRLKRSSRARPRTGQT